MREILFRGKRLCNNKWMFGSLFCWNDGECFIVVDDFHHSHYKVDPETVGQFTGLTDKNGKKIFEGDVIRYTEQTINGSDIPCVGKVEFSDGGWAVNVWYLSNWLFDSANGNVQLEDIEVIGNIHDNPELLEGERQ